MVECCGLVFCFVGGGGTAAGCGLFDVGGGEGVLRLDALVDFDDQVGEGCWGEEELLVVGDFADGAVLGVRLGRLWMRK